MKMIILAILLAALQSTAMLGGRALTEKEKVTFGSFVSFGRDRNVSGGVHIGQGKILTAVHVFRGIFDLITVRNIHGEVITEFKIAESRIDNAPAIDFREEGTQIPDLAILTPPGFAKKIIANLPTATLSFENIDDSGKYYLVGVGRRVVNDETGPLDPVPLVGQFQISAGSRNLISSEYKSKKFALGLVGDSGGPLFRLFSNGKAYVLGIATLTVKGTDRFNNYTVFTKLNSDAARGFLSKQGIILTNQN